MQILEEKSDDVIIVMIDDHLDTVTAPDFERRLLGLVDAGERRLMIDCSALAYVNSAGLKVFLIAAKKLDAAGGRMALCALQANVRMVFETIGFDRIMNIADNRAQALAMLRPTAPET